LDRDPHGNVQVAKIETEKFIIDLIEQELKKNQNYKGKFSPLANYFGYEGRCAFPTTFDCDYCYSLGLNAGAIIQAGLTGLMSCVRNLEKEPEDWLPGGYPLVTMMNLEVRKGKNVPVITKALV
jgi:6-phosphofructokinase